MEGSKGGFRGPLLFALGHLWGPESWHGARLRRPKPCAALGWGRDGTQAASPGDDRRQPVPDTSWSVVLVPR